MRHNRWLRVLPAIAITLAMGACDDGLTEINENPNAPETVPVENVLLSGVWDVLANAPNRGAFGQWTQLYHGENWAQHVAQPVYNDEDFYIPRRGIPTNIWNEMYTALTDLQTAKAMAEEAGRDNLWAVAEIMTVYGFQILTDYFGDIPYFQALSLDQDIMFPVYDAQADIYPDLIGRLADAAARINPSGPANFATADPVYHADMEGWRKFANSLRLRLAMRIAETSRSAEAAQSFQAAWAAGPIDAVGGTADAEWSANQPAQNPLFEGIVLAGRTGDFRVSASLIDRLVALDDPRLEVYAEPAVSDGEYRGLRNGLTPSDYAFGDREGGTADFSTIGNAFLAATAPSVILSYAEVLLLGAEAAARGWIGESPAELYEAGIRASMEQYGIGSDAIAAYLAQPAVAYSEMSDIWLQKWFALYLAGPEAFAELRRVGWLDLEPAENSVLAAGEFPSRLYYPPEEALYNPNNYIDLGDDPLLVPVWWMAD